MDQSGPFSPIAFLLSIVWREVLTIIINCVWEECLQPLHDWFKSSHWILFLPACYTMLPPSLSCLPYMCSRLIGIVSRISVLFYHMFAFIHAFLEPFAHVFLPHQSEWVLLFQGQHCVLSHFSSSTVNHKSFPLWSFLLRLSEWYLLTLCPFSLLI